MDMNRTVTGQTLTIKLYGNGKNDSNEVRKSRNTRIGRAQRIPGVPVAGKTQPGRGNDPGRKRLAGKKYSGKYLIQQGSPSDGMAVRLFGRAENLRGQTVRNVDRIPCSGQNEPVPYAVWKNRAYSGSRLNRMLRDMGRMTNMLIRLNATRLYTAYWEYYGNIPYLDITIFRGDSLLKYYKDRPVYKRSVFFDTWPYTDDKGEKVEIEEIVNHLILLVG